MDSVRHEPGGLSAGDRDEPVRARVVDRVHHALVGRIEEELASYNTPSQRLELEAILSRHTAEEIEELEGMLNRHSAVRRTHL